jgi:hypothetical protein
MLAGSPKEHVSIAMKWDITPKIAPNPNRAMGVSKVISPTTNLAQSECNYLIFLKERVFKWEVLCFLNIGASHNFITQENVERMELQSKELKAPIEMHFVNGITHPITLQARDVPL